MSSTDATSASGRRRFLALAAATTVVPFLARLAVPVAAAQGLPKLPLDHPQAKALAYIEDAEKTKHASFKPGSHCANCQFYTAANQGCSLFPGFSVEPKGWCAAWAKKA